MKTLNTFILLAAITTNALADTVNFDDLKTGGPPPGWTATKTGIGEVKWEIVADDTPPPANRTS